MLATRHGSQVLTGHSAAFSRDGVHIITAALKQTARVWNVASGREIAAFRKYKRYTYSGRFSPDGSQIVTVGDTARIWDAATAEEIAVLFEHDREGLVYSADFSPDGTRIVTASSDGTARIWDAQTAKEIAVLRGHEDEVYSAGFSPDGSRIITASADKTARIWDIRFAIMSTQDLIVVVCTRRLHGRTKLSRDEMRLAGYPDTMPEIDVGEGIA
jgi:WD40 repeat protein